MRATLQKAFVRSWSVGSGALILACFWGAPPTSAQARTDDDAAQVRGAPNATAAERDRNIKGCTIKGDVSLSGDFIYYLPSHPSYKEIKIIRYNGGTMFCTEAAARAAGWKPAP